MSVSMSPRATLYFEPGTGTEGRLAGAVGVALPCVSGWTEVGRSGGLDAALLSVWAGVATSAADACCAAGAAEAISSGLAAEGVAAIGLSAAFLPVISGITRINPTAATKT